MLQHPCRRMVWPQKDPRTLSVAGTWHTTSDAGLDTSTCTWAVAYTLGKQFPLEVSVSSPPSGCSSGCSCQGQTAAVATGENLGPGAGSKGFACHTQPVSWIPPTGPPRPEDRALILSPLTLLYLQQNGCCSLGAGRFPSPWRL